VPSNTKWRDATVIVMQMANNGGFKLSELTGMQKAVCNNLIKRGKLEAYSLPSGDWLVSKP
jgi:hypothetical protein